LLKVGSKRRRTRAEIEEDGLCAQIKEQINEDLERETASLKKQLVEKQQEANSNQNAAHILMQFISNGDAVMDEGGNVKLVPNHIKNEESFMH